MTSYVQQATDRFTTFIALATKADMAVEGSGVQQLANKILVSAAALNPSSPRSVSERHYVVEQIPRLANLVIQQHPELMRVHDVFAPDEPALQAAAFRGVSIALCEYDQDAVRHLDLDTTDAYPHEQAIDVRILRSPTPEFSAQAASIDDLSEQMRRLVSIKLTRSEATHVLAVRAMSEARLLPGADRTEAAEIFDTVVATVAEVADAALRDALRGGHRLKLPDLNGRSAAIAIAHGTLSALTNATQRLYPRDEAHSLADAADCGMRRIAEFGAYQAATQIDGSLIQQAQTIVIQDIQFEQ